MRELVIVSAVTLVLAVVPLVLAEEDEPPPPPASGETASGDDFTPTEQLRHDQEVDFPVDI